MNIVDVLGAPVHDHAAPELPGSPPCDIPPFETSGPQPAARPRKGVAAIAAGATLILGAVAGWSAASIRPEPTATGSPVPTLLSVPADVAGTAEVFTSLYLTGAASATDLATIYTGEAPPPSPTWINSSHTVSGQMLGQDLWGVTVLVDSLEALNGDYQPVPLRYFLVPISTASDRPVATAAPAHIPPPAATAGTDEFTAPVAVDQAAAATTFIEHYLTGADDVARYMSATARVLMFATAPYVSAVATPQGSDDRDRVRIRVTATNQRGIAHDLDYTVALTFDGAVWEITDLVAGSQ